jgi:hypothetical protein
VDPAIDPSATWRDPIALMRRETAVNYGNVPRGLDGHDVPASAWHMGRDAFLYRPEPGCAFLYRRGEGVTVDASGSTDPGDVALWLNGTVYAAVASLNGLLPLHASAVAHDGRAYAFSGPPGAGKSTLAAALGRLGFPLLCDDTLILDLAGTGAVTGLPGHKQLKLWPAGLALAGAEQLALVSADYPKYFAAPPAGVVGQPLPLAGVLFLEPGPDCALIPLVAGERVARLQDDHYTATLFEQSGRLARPARFAQLAAIAARLPMGRLVRPFVEERFDTGLAFVADCLRGETTKWPD